LGLIINEIVSNSIKYAFPHDKTGKISINLKYYDDKYKLTISDNGIGFPENLDFRNIESTLGLKLVNSLVKQLDGSIDLDTSQGTKFTIKFKELKYKKRI
jgi:two-component sensor histidine kinase